MAAADPAPLYSYPATAGDGIRGISRRRTYALTRSRSPAHDLYPFALGPERDASGRGPTLAAARRDLV